MNLTAPVQPLIPKQGDRVWAQIRDGEPWFATDALVLEIDDASVLFKDMLGGGWHRIGRTDVTFYPQHS